MFITFIRKSDKVERKFGPFDKILFDSRRIVGIRKTKKTDIAYGFNSHDEPDELVWELENEQVDDPGFSTDKMYDSISIS